MNIHEYQAKALLRAAGVPVSDGRVVLRAEEAKTAASGIDGPVCLYSERNLFSLLMEAGGAVIKTATSALGEQVRGVAARV